jgi:L-alanine-DL-glutamate epimerase-like enolase superfamily enzyme
MAVLDIVGQVLQTPVCNLLGGRFRDEVRVYADCHAGEEYTPESYAAKAREVVDAGFTALKFDLDVPNPHQLDTTDDPYPARWWLEPYNRAISNAERRFMESLVAAVREEVGPDLMLMMDCHWKFNVPDAIKLAQALEPYDLLWLEDPVPPENVDALLTVRQSTRTPICSGENVYRKHGYRRMLEQQAVSIVSPDMGKMGGLTEGKRVADLADMYYIPVAPHNCASPVGTIASAQLCSTLSNFIVLEYHAYGLDWWEQLIVRDSPVIRDGFIAIPDSPGIGVQLDEAVAREHAKPGTAFFGETL